MIYAGRITTSAFVKLLKHLRYVEDKTFALFPAEAGIRDGLAVNTAVNTLAAVLYIALDHQTLNHSADVAIVTAGMKDFL